MRSRLHLAAVAAVLLSANALVGTLTATSTRAHAAMATVPRPDHVVIVLEENHSATGIIANPSAPYINSLAAGNANFTQSYAETQPS